MRTFKTIAVFLAIFFSGTLLQGQDVTGQWNGVLIIQEMNLRLVFHINKTGDSYTSTMDSPDQGAAGIPVTTTTFNGSKLSLAIPNIGMLYEGEFKSDSIVGTFKQNGLSLPLTLKRALGEIKSFNWPQESKQPFLYQSAEFIVENKTVGLLTKNVVIKHIF